MDIYQPELAALAALPGPGPLPGAAPADVLALVIGLATAWFTASPALRDLAAEPPWSPGRLAAHRAAVVAAAAALTATTPARRPDLGIRLAGRCSRSHCQLVLSRPGCGPHNSPAGQAVIIF
jgi:hypothetical protein